ncbi:hypothetical protein [Nocardia altamirensis]|uniref:hypothetical protein n=1 Tax=Nocardia altamirensis TaxID=472158 RepID=UPI000B0B7DD0|nr:hypothetical protein [Nocardia altamirensis]
MTSVADIIAMGWYERAIVLTGKQPLAVLLVAFLAAFLFIRLSVRMIRAEVAWWPRNITPGGLHIHHVVFGVGFMLVAGFGGFSPIGPRSPWMEIFAGLFGVGAALVLDEFALILHLRDVYWAEQGRLSVDAVFIGAAICGLLLLGAAPFGVADTPLTGWQFVGVILVNAVLALVTLLKGKIWTGLVGLFIPIVALVGAVRLARPGSPWARSAYPPGSREAIRAAHREQRGGWMRRLRIAVYNAVAGRPTE